MDYFISAKLVGKNFRLHFCYEKKNNTSTELLIVYFFLDI